MADEEKKEIKEEELNQINGGCGSSEDFDVRKIIPPFIG